MLSRVSWPAVELPDLLERLSQACRGSEQTGGHLREDRGTESYRLKRVCIQATDRADTLDNLLTLVPVLKEASGVPVSTSFRPRSLGDIGRLFDAGVDRLGIAIDAADPEVYARVKGESFESAKEFLFSAASQYKGRISTHIIVGLGETEESAVRLISECLSAGLTVGLFAFTPVKGTALESSMPPEIGKYRRVQVALHLLKHGLVTVEDFHFTDGRIHSIDVDPTTALETLADGSAFLTSGCDGCNRPYYNERPAAVPYNYPRPLGNDEVLQAVEATGLWAADAVNAASKKVRGA